MPKSTRLSVNVDHVATVRQARRAAYPDPVDAARIAEAAGAGGITVHLRGDRRHIQEHDVARLRPVVRGKLNLEMPVDPTAVDLALQLSPDQVTLVPERPEEVTTEGGLDAVRHFDTIATAAKALRAVDIAVSVFIDPDLEQLEALTRLGADLVEGFEINTDRYTRAGASADRELEQVLRAASEGAQLGFRVYAGHGLTTANVGPVAASPVIEELNIGHAIVSRSILVGMKAAVEEMLTAMDAGVFADR